MKPKQKAEDLVDKYIHELPGEHLYYYQIQSLAIECAKIAVSELMDNDCGGCRQSNQEYWGQVLNELNKMS